MQELINKAQDAISPYAPGTVYDYVIIDRTPIEVVEAAISEANDAIASGEPEALTKAYNNLVTAINSLSSLQIYNWIPNSDLTSAIAYLSHCER